MKIHQYQIKTNSGLIKLFLFQESITRDLVQNKWFKNGPWKKLKKKEMSQNYVTECNIRFKSYY